MANKKRAAWFGKMTEPQLKELHEFLADKETTYVEIAGMYGVEPHHISVYARKHGIHRHATHASKAKLAGVPVELSKVQKELDKIAAEEVALKARKEELRAKEAELQIRFECEDGDVLVYGIAATPLRAPAGAWIAFLNHEGARRLREAAVAAGRKVSR